MIRTIAKIACCVFAISNLWIMEQQAKADAPDFIKVYSRDGRESFTVWCNSKSTTEVTCKFVHVRITPPKKKDAFPTSKEDMEELAKMDSEGAKEFKEDPQKFRAQLEDFPIQVKKEICTPESMARIEERIRDPYIGPKRKRVYEGISRACSDQNPWDFQTLGKVKSDMDLDARSCTLYVDSFSLDFKKVDEGRWLYTQEKPGLLSNVLKIYELTADRSLWNLTETRVPMSSAEGEAPQDEPQRTVWSWNNYSEYETPPQCEFISHRLVQGQLP